MYRITLVIDHIEAANNFEDKKEAVERFSQIQGLFWTRGFMFAGRHNGWYLNHNIEDVKGRLILQAVGGTGFGFGKKKD